MTIINWEVINSLHTFVNISENSFILKAMNTKRLITDYSKLITLGNSLNFYIHTLESLDDVIIGYKIVSKNDSFKFVTINKKYLVYGTSDLYLRKPKDIYEDDHLKVFKYGKDNFLFLSKK